MTCGTELAKIDPSVSVLCDVHNTLVNTVLRKYATKEIQDKYLPELANSKVGRVIIGVEYVNRLTRISAGLLLPLRTCVGVGRLCLADACSQAR